MSKDVNSFGTRKVGRLLISMDGIRNEPEQVRNILSNMIPIGLLLNSETQVMEYMCIGDMFDELDDNEMVPIYHTQIFSDGEVVYKRIEYKKVVKDTVKDEIMQLIFQNNVNLEEFKAFVRTFSKADDKDFEEYDANFMGVLRIYLEREKGVVVEPDE